MKIASRFLSKILFYGAVIASTCVLITCGDAGVAATPTTPTTPPVTTDTEPPGNVTDVSIAVSTDVDTNTASVVLNWTNPTDSDFSHVEITWTPNPPDEPQTTDQTTLTVNDLPVLPGGQLYSFTILSVDALDNKTDLDAGKTIVVSIVVSADFTAPAAITDFSSVIAKGIATLTWTDPPDEDLQQINITWSSPGGGAPGTALQPLRINANAQTTTITGLSNTEAYTFSATSQDGHGNISDAAVTTAQAIAVPDVINLSATPGVNGSAILNWTYPDADAFGDSSLSHALISWLPPGGITPRQVRVPSGDGTAVAGAPGMGVIQGLADGVEYTFTVKLENAVAPIANISGGEASVLIADAIAPSITFTATALQSSGIRLNWTNPTDDPGFVLDGSGGNGSQIEITWGNGETMVVEDNIEQVDITTGLTLGDAVFFDATVTDGLGHTTTSDTISATPALGQVAIFSLGTHAGDFGFSACQTALDSTTGTGATAAIASRLRSDGFTKAVFFGSTDTYNIGQIAVDTDALVPVASGWAQGGAANINTWARTVRAYSYDDTSETVNTRETFTYAGDTSVPTIGGVVNVTDDAGQTWQLPSAGAHLGTVPILVYLGFTTPTRRFWSFTRQYRVLGNSCNNASSSAVGTMGVAGSNNGLSPSSSTCNNTYYVLCVAQ